MATISFRAVEKTYPEGTRAVESLDLEIGEGELLVLLGPSGCGKTTVLRLLAGLETPTRGQILVGDRRVDGLPAAERDIAMIFQSYALYPHKTVRQNLAFPLKMRRTPRPERERRVREVAELLDLGPLLEKRPGQLSGGQQQRVAIGRALVREPAAFLMDEPLSNLDAELRTKIRTELGALQRRLGITTLFVTHDQTEAMTLGDRVALLREGSVQQLGTPDELYRHPANVFVASFIGQPGMNLLSASVVDTAYGRRLRLEGGERDKHLAVSLDALPMSPSERTCVGWRPEALHLCEPEGADAICSGTVRLVESLGPQRLLHVETGLKGWDENGGGTRGTTLTLRASTDGSTPQIHDRVGIRASKDDAHVFDAEGLALRRPEARS